MKLMNCAEKNLLVVLKRVPQLFLSFVVVVVVVFILIFFFFGSQDHYSRVMGQVHTNQHRQVTEGTCQLRAPAW